MEINENNVSLFPVSDESAIEKIEKELKSFKGGNKAKAVSGHVAANLKSFCKNAQFAAAVIKSEKTLSDCCEEIMKKVGDSISDIEVYRRAAKFYFPGAVVKFSMQIEVDGKIEAAEETALGRESTPKRKKIKQESNVIQVSLFD